MRQSRAVFYLPTQNFPNISETTSSATRRPSSSSREATALSRSLAARSEGSPLSTREIASLIHTIASPSEVNCLALETIASFDVSMPSSRKSFSTTARRSSIPSPFFALILTIFVKTVSSSEMPASPLSHLLRMAICFSACR